MTSRDQCAPAEGAEDMSFMGSMDDASAKFLSAVDLWISLRQPFMATKALHKKRDAAEHEARFRLANAATLLAWHMRASPTDAADLAAARAERNAYLNRCGVLDHDIGNLTARIRELEAIVEKAKPILQTAATRGNKLGPFYSRATALLHQIAALGQSARAGGE